MKFRMPGAAGSGLTDGGLPPRVAGRKPTPVDREAEISGGHAPVAAMQTMLVPPPAQQLAAKPPDASSEAIVACKATGRPYTGDQLPPGYPDARGERAFTATSGTCPYKRANGLFSASRTDAAGAGASRNARYDRQGAGGDRSHPRE